MVYNVVANIEIDGNAISNYYSLIINQHFNEHHHFNVKLPYEVIDDKEGFTLSKIKNLIGKVILIRLEEGANKTVQNEFKGIITDVSIEQFDAYHTLIVVKGASPTIVLESGPHINCFLQKDLKKIFNDTIGEAGLECKTVVSSSNSTPIPYLTQYKESHFQFLNRLAAEYGEWFYYNGKELVFGKPASSKDIELISGEDVTSLQVKLQLLPLDSKTFSYFAAKNDMLTGTTPGSISELGEFGKFVASESSKMFSKTTSTGIRPKAENSGQVSDSVKVLKSGTAAQLEVLTGTSINPAVVLGATATISISTKTDNDFSKQEYGKFVIIGVTHQISEDGKYINSFESLPDAIAVIPVKNVQRPVAETQVAQVVNNDDPDKLGRVKVKMLWQENLTTDWIRVLTPDGGTGGKTGKNRGFVFIPEVDDQVLIGFEYNDPDWPFVLGSVFHGKSSEGGGDKNAVKTIGTNSGHRITFNDTEKSILIEDAKGNKINFDGQGKIAMESSDSIEFKCGQSSITMAKDGSIKVKGGNVALEGTTELGMKAPNVSAKADANLKLEGAMTAVKGSGQVSVEGAMAKLAGSGMTEITGGIVKIN